MMGNCDNCSNDKAEAWLGSFIEGDEDKEVLWCEWVREEENEMAHPRRNSSKKADKTKSSSTKQTKKVCRAGTVSEAVDSLMEKIPTFLTHVFVKREQSSCFQEKLSNIPDGNAVIQVDFSENYSFQQQGEIQSA